MAVLEDVLNQIEEQFNQTQNEISETTEQTGHRSLKMENELLGEPINGATMR